MADPRAVLDVIRQRADNATNGPWRSEMMGSEGSIVHAGGMTILTARRIARTPEFDDAEFIAAARSDVPRLVAALTALVDAHKPQLYTASAMFPNPLCSCGAEYPCPTVRAITDALTPKENERD